MKFGNEAPTLIQLSSRMFGAKCFKCCRMISPTDWVRKAREQVKESKTHNKKLKK